MLLQVIDGQGLLATVIAAGQETVVDHSGSITNSSAQELLALNRKPLRLVYSKPRYLTSCI